LNINELQDNDEIIEEALNKAQTYFQNHKHAAQKPAESEL